MRRRKPLPKRSSAVNQQSSGSGSDLELASATRPLRRRNRWLCTKVQNEQVYDADGELSSGTESQRSRRKFKELTPNIVDDDGIFSFDEMDQDNAAQQVKCRSTVLGGKCKKTSSTENFKVPTLPKRSSGSFYSSFKKERNSVSTNSHLRVSFSDDSFNEVERYRRSVPEHGDKQGVVETSTPANSSHSYSAGKIPRVSLTRLSSLASPILMDTSDIVRSRRSQPKELSGSVSSGYESLLKSGNSVQDSSPKKSDGSLKRPCYELFSDEIEIHKSPPTSFRKQRKIAIKKVKEREERYLEEIKGLDDYELCIE